MYVARALAAVPTIQSLHAIIRSKVELGHFTLFIKGMYHPLNCTEDCRGFVFTDFSIPKHTP
jgi:hypothetical protein